jgi:two-component system sensor histidine kinase/response regulator
MIGKGSILVIDDTLANLKLMIATLTAAGYEVRPLLDPTRAVEVALIEKPDLILLDIAMPVIDGYTVCRNLKAQWLLREVPIILVSAQGEPLDNARIRSVGADDFAGKPLNLDELLLKVNRLITRSG